MRAGVGTTEGLGENIRFLVLEVGKQLTKTREFLADPAPEVIENLRLRDDYIDNLKTVIQRHCFSLAAETGAGADRAWLDYLKSVDTISVNLERIADFCEKIFDQVGYLKDYEILRGYDFGSIVDEVIQAVREVEGTAGSPDVDSALKICSVENKLDQFYSATLNSILRELDAGRDSQALVTTLFISHYLERMGDSLLNIGEAVISASLGERIKIDQFWALEDTLDRADAMNGAGRAGRLTMSAMGETRSGCRINRVSNKDADELGRSVIFKEGRKQKLLDETLSIAEWHKILPGVAPEVYSFSDHGQTAAILFEYLNGQTFEQLLLREDSFDFDHALDLVCETIGAAWRKTRDANVVPARFMRQMRARLPDVFALYPGLEEIGGGFANGRGRRIEDLVAKCYEIESEIETPFSVFIHGDFNIDNIIYDSDASRVHFIDLHRSTMSDYVQDVSVFLVSNLRMPILAAPVRRRIDRVTHKFLAFARAFAREQGDGSFEVRLALGLARSFATSTRFILNEAFAKRLFLHARYLLERVVQSSDIGFENFRVPEEVLSE